jgi:dephospho-CoA kinase
MKVIGICGASGSGKTTVCSILSSYGAVVLDCDKIYHELVSQKSACLDQIKQEFGSRFVVGDRLDRATLAKIVFSDSEKLARLNAISHHHILLELKRRLSALESEACDVSVIDAPLLFESGLDSWCDLVCAVLSSQEMQVSRLCKRDKISIQEAKTRLNHQLSSDQLRKKADFIIENDGDLDSLKVRCADLMKTALTRKEKSTWKTAAN